MRGKFISGYLMDNKHMPAWIILLLFILQLKCCLTLDLTPSDNERNNWVVLKVKTADKHLLLTQFEKQNFTLIYEITPSTLIMKCSGNYNGHRSLHDALKSLLALFSDEILEAEVVRIYEDTLKPLDAFEKVSTGAASNVHTTNLDLDHYYGKDVSTVWSRGYSGKGTVVGITGVGLETRLLDLQRNVVQSWCFNFVANTSDVTPETFTSTQKKAVQLTDHGNRIASVIAAERENNICGAGISFHGRIVGIKMFAIWEAGGPVPSHWTASDIVARALVHNLQNIDIFVNAWSPTLPFDPLDLASREAIVYGATKGRSGLGTVHVVPAGPAGNMLSHNIHTITVGMVGVNGTIPSNAVADTSVLTSGLGDGSNITSSYMVTSSHGNACITDFKGYSAAAAYISGIIALGLEANPGLSLRDIQHLLVIASDHKGLKESVIFKRNAAGLYFHEMLGFGLLNAEKFVSFSENRTPAPPLLSRTVKSSEIRITSNSTTEINFYHTCEITKDPDCLTTIEHVVVSMDFNIPTNIVNMEIRSPSCTGSVIMDLKINTGITQKKRNVTLVSVNFWNELAFGRWTLKIQTSASSNQTRIGSASLTLYGTRNETVADAKLVLLKTVCEDDKSISTARVPVVVATISESPKQESESDSGDKQNIALFVILPVGVLLMCGITIFLLMRGGHHGPISSYGAPKKKASHRRRCDSLLHRQISLLRQKSRHDSTSEDEENEIAE